MFGLSFSELFIIGIVALIVLGPERLPKVARTAGHLMGRVQRYVSDVKSDIQREMNIQELSKIKEDVKGAANQIRQDFDKAVADIKDPLLNLKNEIGDTSQQLKQAITQDLPDLNQLRPTKEGESPESPLLEDTSTKQQVSESLKPTDPNKAEDLLDQQTLALKQEAISERHTTKEGNV
ncbi:Sec-independent protein translocase protein TatB [Pelistega ratti]|uniref:Sec-independent protein translocase protein TatB n=1 Tax=Pelistega ratti TaxID=2652177 RepID=UPI00135BDB98|nr:Sec-independent protein translocase protein TatB [Pelistega ratti]